jgi:ribosomal-protein-alanine N-acetyltransferase
MSALPQPRQWHRALGVQDLEAVLDIEVRAYSHPWTRGNFIDSIASGYLCEGLWSEGRGALGYFVAMAGVGELHLLNLTVDPAVQGQGHGSALLRAIQDRALALGLATLWLEVRHSNERARGLYRRRGFAEVGLRKGYYPAAMGREDAVVMSLQCLTSPKIPNSPTKLTVGPQRRDGGAADGLD